MKRSLGEVLPRVHAPRAATLGSMAFHSTVMQTTVKFMCLLKKNDEYAVRLLLKCFDDIKAWMALNFLNFNDNKDRSDGFWWHHWDPPCSSGFLGPV